jgi:hypothetical protein
MKKCTHIQRSFFYTGIDARSGGREREEGYVQAEA